MKAKKIAALVGNATPEQVQDIISMRTRAEKIAIKDAKLRTFITQDDSRDDLVTMFMISLMVRLNLQIT